MVISQAKPSMLDPVLASLSPKDVQVLDDIIAKAPDATAFTTVFKAYSEVLRQKGLDPGEDVVYYKQLLKLGIIKGINWGTKWKIVKAQLPVANVLEHSPLQDADRFRRLSLLTTYFQTWRCGVEWIRTTYLQIDEAKANIQLRIYFTRWRNVLVNYQRQVQEAESIESKRILYSVLHRWYKGLAKRRIRKFNEKLNLKVSDFQQKCQRRLYRKAWMKWYRLHVAEQFRMRHICLRVFRGWSTALQKLDSLENLADQFEEMQDLRIVKRLWDLWYRRCILKDMEIYVAKRVSFRVLKQSFEHLLHQAQERRCANAIYSRNLRKRLFGFWRKALSHREALVQRSDKYINRCNTDLLRAVIHVWVARERGRLLFRVRDMRIIQTAWTMWQHQLQTRRAMQDQAVLFAQRIFVQLVQTSLASWKQKLKSYHAQEALARERYLCTLAYNVLLVWRLHLRKRLSSFRTAKIARKYFLEKSTWNRWRSALEAIRRKKKLRIIELEFLKKLFTKWKTTYQQRNQEKRLLETYLKLTHKHILNKYMELWTRRTILIKIREMDVGDRYNKQVLSDAFNKWKEAHFHNLENLSLVRSYLDVKREETLRRTFATWLATARKTRVRRMRIAEREEEIRLDILTMAWERWRDRFCENALHEAELEVIIRNQRNRLRHAFSSWLSRCNSIPGIRLYATNLKFKMWRKWREALPRAIQASKAEDVHARKLLRNIFDIWKEAYRTKIALKAVTRARHLRLPSPGYRASLLDERDPPAMKPSIRRPLRSQPLITPAEKAPVPIVLLSNKYKEKQSSLNISPSRSSPINLTPRATGPSLSEDRQWPAARKDMGDDNERDVRALLWTKLRNAQVARHTR